MLLSVGFGRKNDKFNCYAAFMSSPCHIELVLTEKNSDVKNETVGLAVLCIVCIIT